MQKCLSRDKKTTTATVCKFSLMQIRLNINRRIIHMCSNSFARYVSRDWAFPLCEAWESSTENVVKGNPATNVLNPLIFSLFHRMVKISSQLSRLRLIHLPHNQIALVTAVLDRLVRLEHDGVLHVAVACGAEKQVWCFSHKCQAGREVSLNKTWKHAEM